MTGSSSGSPQRPRQSDSPAGEFAPARDVTSPNALPAPEAEDSHPTDPSRTRSGQFKKDFVHNGAGRRGKRAKKSETDLAALLRSIAYEPIGGSSPVTGKPLTVIEALTRSVIQGGFKDSRIALAVLEIMVRSGALLLSTPEEVGSLAGDAATLDEFVARVRRQERARLNATRDADEDENGGEGR